MGTNDQVFRQNELNEKPGKEGAGSQKDAKGIFEGAELNSLQGSSSELDHDQLDDDGADQDDDEEWVVEEVLEDVNLRWLQFSGIDFVENLEHHENVEEDGIVLSGFLVPVAD